MPDPSTMTTVELRRAIAEAMKLEREAIYDLIVPWRDTNEMRLRAGELTSGEVIAVRAVLTSILMAISSRGEVEGWQG